MWTKHIRWQSWASSGGKRRSIGYLPSHLTPCLNRPYNNEPQWSQNVGDMNVHVLNRCGRSILNRSRKYCKTVPISIAKSSSKYPHVLTIVLSELKLDSEHGVNSLTWHLLCTAVWQAANKPNSIIVCGKQFNFGTHWCTDIPACRSPKGTPYKMHRTWAA